METNIATQLRAQLATADKMVEELQIERAMLVEALYACLRAYDGTGGTKGVQQQTAAEQARRLLHVLANK